MKIEQESTQNKGEFDFNDEDNPSKKKEDVLVERESGSPSLVHREVDSEPTELGAVVRDNAVSASASLFKSKVLLRKVKYSAQKNIL
jgi:hypothetical protein